jgi:hypothetical protein
LVEQQGGARVLADDVILEIERALGRFRQRRPGNEGLLPRNEQMKTGLARGCLELGRRSAPKEVASGCAIAYAGGCGTSRRPEEHPMTSKAAATADIQFIARNRKKGPQRGKPCLIRIPKPDRYI